MQSLEQMESLEQGKVGLAQAKESTEIGQAGTTFSQKLSEEAKKFGTDMGVDASLAGVLPMALRGASALARARASALNSKWKSVNAERFNKQQQGGGETEEDVEPFESGEVPNPAFNPNELDDEFGQDLMPSGAGGRVDISGGGTQGQSGIPKVANEEEDIPETQNLSSQIQSEESEDQPLISSATAAEESVEDLAPEITTAAETAETVASTLGSAIPIVSGILGIAGLGMGISSIIKSTKEEGQDPYAAIQPKLKSATNQINALESDIGSDQFAERVGAKQPSFGSLAERPQMPNLSSGIALHL
jgi:hypothetical protein